VFASWHFEKMSNHQFSVVNGIESIRKGQKDGTNGVFFCLTTQRMPSKGHSEFYVAIAALSFFCLAVGFGFAWLGAWMVLPFAGLEVVALVSALAWVLRHKMDSESLSINGDIVSLVVNEQGKKNTIQFNRLWVQLVVLQRFGNLRLVLRSRGQEIEVGRFLVQTDRLFLAQELRARLGSSMGASLSGLPRSNYLGEE